MKSPKVSIISINYNQPQYTRELIKSLMKINYSNFEIIIVDNGSDSNELNNLQGMYSKVKFIRSDKNLGFSGGNNLGISNAEGDYFLFLNNDTEVDPDFLDPMVETFQNNPKIGIISPKIKYFNTNLIQYAGGGKINPYTGRNFKRGFKQEDTGKFNTRTKTDLIHGAAMMVPRRIVNKIDPMPEIFFLYYEEIDWCETIKRAGFEAWYVPQSIVYHKESISIGKDSELKTYYLNRNRIVYLRRNTKGLKKLSWIIFFIFFTIPKNLIRYLIRLELKHLNAFLKGIVWNLKHLNLNSTSPKKIYKQHLK